MRQITVLFRVHISTHSTDKLTIKDEISNELEMMIMWARRYWVLLTYWADLLLGYKPNFFIFK